MNCCLTIMYSQEKILFGAETPEQNDKRSQIYSHHSSHRHIQPKTSCRKKYQIQPRVKLLQRSKILLQTIITKKTNQRTYLEQKIVVKCSRFLFWQNIRRQYSEFTDATINTLYLSWSNNVTANLNIHTEKHDKEPILIHKKCKVVIYIRQCSQ